MGRTFVGVAGFRAGVGEPLDPGQWFTVTQERINAFADTTEDWQWIHVDPARAAASDLGATIAHGYLTLSLVPRLTRDVFEFAEVGRAVNYGIDRVRFPAPVHPGDQVRAHAEVMSVTDVSRGVLGRVRIVVEVRGRTKPACALEALMLVLPPPTELQPSPG